MKKRKQVLVSDVYMREYQFMTYAKRVWAEYKIYHDGGIYFIGNHIYKMDDWKCIIPEWGRETIMRLYKMITAYEKEFYI